MTIDLGLDEAEDGTDRIVVSYSELDSFRDCPLKHDLGYKQRWTKPRSETGALAKGTLWHQVLELHYRALKGKDTQNYTDEQEQKLLAAIRAKVVKDLLADPASGLMTEVQELILWMYDGYVEKYGTDRDWKILAVEHHAVIPLLDRNAMPSRFHLKVKLDLVVQVRSLGTRWLIDHKSGQNLPTQLDLELDDQFGLYEVALRHIGKGVQGSLHNAARTQRNKSPMTLDSRMSRTYMDRTDVELNNIALDAYNTAVAAYPDDPKYIARYSSPNPRQCGWKCDFRNAHLAARMGRRMSDVLPEFGFQIDKTRH